MHCSSIVLTVKYGNRLFSKLSYLIGSIHGRRFTQFDAVCGAVDMRIEMLMERRSAWHSPYYVSNFVILLPALRLPSIFGEASKELFTQKMTFPSASSS